MSCVMDSSKAAGVTVEFILSGIIWGLDLTLADFSRSCWLVLLLSVTEKPQEQVLSPSWSPPCSRTGILPAGKTWWGFLHWSKGPNKILCKFSLMGLDNFTLLSWKRFQERLLLSSGETGLFFPGDLFSELLTPGVMGGVSCHICG